MFMLLNEQSKKTVLVVFGTRPEAIKMAPLIKELRNRSKMNVIVCVTGQHREMLDQVLHVFDIVPDYDFAIMKKRQDLFDITEIILSSMKKLLMKVKADLVLVHGDTSTSFATALACFYMKIPVGHVEAGLRSNDLYSPFPEEFNRQAVGLIASLHFAPTDSSKTNLIAEGKDEKSIFVTGNTAIDGVKMTIQDDYKSEHLDWAKGSKLILITAHRRENIGKPMRNMFRAIRRIMDEHPDVKAIYPIHLNPEIRQTALKYFGDCNNIRIIEPLDVFDFHNLMQRCYLILTDSGGIQEEATALGKPVLVMRDSTERPEGLKAGTLKLVGSNEKKIYTECRELINSETEYNKMTNVSNPYGDGSASQKIADVLDWYLHENKGQRKIT